MFSIINKNKSSVLMIGLSCLAIVYMINRPQMARAQLFGSAACSVPSVSLGAVPVHDQSAAAVKNVQCTWNGIAWQMAHVVLHQLTMSVVNWINSGFNGSPSFLSDPEGFFLDAADQATGAFIAANGPLGSLCSPFSLDIRLSLALGQAPSNQRYTCTLSKIIQTQQGNVQRLQNGQLVNVSVNQTANGATLGDILNGNVASNTNMVSINGASINGFVGGDFSQGGLPAFAAMTTDPRNNPFGASIQAKSDLQMQILAKQNATNNDLNRGGGFLSWQKCDSVMDQWGDPVQQCHTETPGSVISASLNKQLGAPTDELQLTNEINQVVSALFSQLVTKVLSSGLLSSSQASVSSSPGGISQSYVNQLSNDPQLNANLSSLKSQAVTIINTYITPMQQASTYHSQAATAIVAEQTAYNNTLACLQNKTQSTSAILIDYETEASQLQNIIDSQVTPQVTQYQSYFNQNQSDLTQVQNMSYQLQNAASSQDLASLNTDFTTEISALSPISTDPDKAKSDLAAANATVKQLQATLVPYQNSCNGSLSNF